MIVLVAACSGGKPGDTKEKAAPAAASKPAATKAEAPPAAEGAAAADVEPGLSIEFLKAHTRTLSDDRMQGRRPGTEGAKLAVAHIVATMEQVGLSPAGEDGGWTQAVGMRAVHAKIDQSSARLVGKGDDEALAFGTDYVLGSYGKAGKHTFDAPLVFAGYGVTAPEHDWDDLGTADYEGKILVVFVGDPPVDDGRFGGDAMTYYGRWTYKYERALEAGAAGALVIHETEPASYGWNVVENSWSNERFHVTDKGGELPRHLPIQGWISQATAEELAKRAGSSLEAWHAAAMKKGFAPIDTGVRLAGTLQTGERRLTDVNVLGKIAGSERADEAVVLTAHWDHLGTKADAKEGEDAIFNGAVDNASGTAALLGVAADLAARAKQGKGPKRSVIFFATTAEEQGLLGARYFAAHPLVPPAKIAGVVNMDSMNVHGRTKAVQVVGFGQSTLEDVLAAALEGQGRPMLPEEHPERGSFYRSDHFPFAKIGVPALYFRGNSDMEDGGLEAGKKLQALKAKHYHQVSDEFDPSWSFEGALQDAQVVADVVMRVANADTMPAWKPTSEFAKIAR